MINLKNIPFYILCLVLVSCTEPFPIPSIGFEDILVVESVVTDELKHQTVKISRSIDLTNIEENIVNNADVRIEASNGTEYAFTHDTETGDYISDIEFQALPDLTYTLRINTQNGQTYSSLPVTLTPSVQLDRLYAQAETQNGINGVQVFVDADNLSSDGQYFKYEYEETYETALPNASGISWEIIDLGTFTRSFTIEIGSKRIDTHCYSTDFSSGILQTTTSSLNEGRLFRFPVRFIPEWSTVLKEKYSILVKQYVQNKEAHTFYKTLKELGDVESLLSQSQPGFVTGNITADNDPTQKVMGFFEVSSVSSQRIFFDYTDFGFDRPPFFVECNALSIEGHTSTLRRLLEFENYEVFSFSVDGLQPVYHIAKSECTQCTLESTHIKPEFWEE